ncbi:Nucleosome-remodeling factor subunit BPTF [Trichuris trichiura]|uniref:Nucleosome-remodeling factor subunit BPTF n=1 Tax=Trichuris trichiura TaxID=36087 RepID=A0A077ZIL7_TRITR|nr:Nucleosome-remodeling factor subunit BPTF [Trichuris trichiura]
MVFNLEKQRAESNPALRFESKGLRIPLPLRRPSPKRPIHVIWKKPESSANVSQRRGGFAFPTSCSRQESASHPAKKRSVLRRASKETSTRNVFLDTKDVVEKFYIACSLCSRWFHGICVDITESQSKQMISWHCRDCQKERERTVQELHCICRTPYDESRPYVCCDVCEGWFHCECVGLTAEAAEAIPLYVCKICDEKRDVNAMVKQLTSADYGKLENLVVDLLDHKMSWPFRGTSSGDVSPSYNKLQPDTPGLRTILDGVMQHSYCTLSDFAVDMAKVFNGVRRRYGTNASEFQCANVIEALFTEKLRSIKVLPFLPSLQSVSFKMKTFDFSLCPMICNICGLFVPSNVRSTKETLVIFFFLAGETAAYLPRLCVHAQNSRFFERNVLLMND